MAKDKVTSKKVATTAAKVLASPKAAKGVKSVAASALAQRVGVAKTGRKAPRKRG